MKVVNILTEEQKELINGKEFRPDSYFNVVTDADGKYFISLEELYSNINPEFEWLNNLPLIDYNPIITNI